MEQKEFLGYLATIIGIIGYIIYYVQIFGGKVKPHAFSWFVWAILTGIAFAAQVSEGGGPGAWVTGMTTLACIGIAMIAYVKGKRDFPRFDWIALISSACSLFLWYITKDPMWSVILVSVTDGLGFLPTYRKAFYKPYEESASAFVFGVIKFIPAIFALDSYSISTVLYPASLIVLNGIFIAVLLIRRAQLRA